MVTLPGLGKIGYVATNYKTMIGESYSSGRLYDKIGNVAYGEVCYVLDHGVLCSLIQKEAKNDEIFEDIDFIRRKNEEEEKRMDSVYGNIIYPNHINILH